MEQEQRRQSAIEALRKRRQQHPAPKVRSFAGDIPHSSTAPSKQTPAPSSPAPKILVPASSSPAKAADSPQPSRRFDAFGYAGFDRKVISGPGLARPKAGINAAAPHAARRPAEQLDEGVERPRKRRSHSPATSHVSSPTSSTGASSPRGALPDMRRHLERFRFGTSTPSSSRQSPSVSEPGEQELPAVDASPAAAAPLRRLVRARPSSPDASSSSSARAPADVVNRLATVYQNVPRATIQRELLEAGGDVQITNRRLLEISSAATSSSKPEPSTRRAAGQKPRKNVKSAIYNKRQPRATRPAQRGGDDSSDGEAEFDEEDSDASAESAEDDDASAEAEAEGVAWFNEAAEQELQDVLAIIPANLSLLVALRPFSSASDVRARLRSTKGLSPNLFDRYLDISASYRKVDALLTECEEVGRELDTAIAGWGVSTAPADDAAGGEVALTQLPAGDMTASDAGGPEDFIKKQPALVDAAVTLKDYQLVGLNWLNLLYSRQTSAILADEMGLGKTIQVISFYAHLKERGVKGPHLVVVPSSTLENWLREFLKFAPGVNVKSYYGDQKERTDLRYDLIDDEELDVLVTTYNLAQGSPLDRNFLKKMHFQTAVFDEGHVLKNRESQRYKHLMDIRAPWRLLLTGTPLQNDLQELVSLLNFILPEYFKHAEDSLRAVFKVKTSARTSLLSRQRVSRAKKMMTPFVLRRKKAQVLSDLPAKHEHIVYCELAPIQRQIYKETMARSRKALLDATATSDADTDEAPGKGKKRGRSAGQRLAPKDSSSHVLMDLRKAANHPMLFRRLFDDRKIRGMARECLKEPEFADSQYELVVEDMEVMTDAELQNFAKTYKSVRRYALDDDVYLDAGKVKALRKILDEAQERGDRVLIFSQFTMVLDILCRILDKINTKYLMFTGATQVDERQSLIDEFFEDSSIPVFLLSTKAGGMGVNLTAANIVVIFDADWNPHSDRQAQDRAFRIGQTKDVQVYKLVSKGTIEEDMLQLADTKLKLDEAVGGGEDDREDGSGEGVEKAVKASLLQKLREKVSDDPEDMA